LGKIINIIEKFEIILDEICKIKYDKNSDKNLIKLKIEEIKLMKISEIYTKIIINYLCEE
jgi:hypothetical protein